jgi:tRNA threonylcarbamoyladenosine biosynthesis protein TsaB
MSITGFKDNRAEPVILAVDTSSPEASLAISSAENVIVTLTVRDDRPHSQTLFSHIETLLQIAEMKIEDVDAFAAATGPGSFTGLRVGLSAIKGLADSLNKPCLGVDSLDLLALASGFDGAQLVVIGAGRGEVYCGLRDLSSGDICGGPIADQVGAPSEVLRVMMQHLRLAPLIITVDGRCADVSALVKLLQMDLASASAPQPIFLKSFLNTSAVLAQRAVRLIEENRHTQVAPHYIRQSDAEMKWTR